jgi:hypothetical protein
MMITLTGMKTQSKYVFILLIIQDIQSGVCNSFLIYRMVVQLY